MAPVRIYAPDEASDDQVDALRRRFLQEVQKKELRDHVHPADVQRARVDHMWLRRFLAHGDLELDKSLDYMIGSVKFRHEWGINELTQESFLRDVPTAFDGGQMSVHTRDLDGYPVLVFHAAIHQRLCGDDWRRGQLCLIYWVERLERLGRGKPISLFLDLGGAGLQNADIPFIQFMIGIFKNYYPSMLVSIIVFEMPWILNAVWKIIKQMLPAKAHILIKFVSKKDITRVMPAESVLERWGGPCTWQWRYRRQDHEMPPSPFLADLQQDAVLQTSEPISDINRNISKCLNTQSSQDTDSQDTASLGHSSQASDLQQESSTSTSRSSWVQHSQSSPSLLENAPSELAVPVSQHEEVNKHKAIPKVKRSMTSSQFASDVGGSRAPAAPVRRRASKRAPPPPPPSSVALGLTHYLSIIDLPGQTPTDQQPAKSPISDSGDSGASCDDLSDRSQNSPEETTANIGDLLEISPGDTIQFCAGRTESCRPITIRCTYHTPVAFKVKTTAPDRFLVRPSRGVVAPGRTASVELRLAAGITAQMALSERFLVLATPVLHAQMTSAELEHHWKSAPVSAMRERRLRCALAPEIPLSSSLVQQLSQQLERLHQRLGQQQQLTDQLAQRAAAGQRWLAGTALALTALAASNVYLLFSSVDACGWP